MVNTPKPQTLGFRIFSLIDLPEIETSTQFRWRVSGGVATLETTHHGKWYPIEAVVTDDSGISVLGADSAAASALDRSD